MGLLRAVASIFVALLAACGEGGGPAPLTLHLAGDSTLGEGLPNRRPETGWGEEMQALFQEDRVRVRNHARRGRSSRTFMSEGSWAGLLAGVKEGDYVIIQFGHNDGSADEEQTPPSEYRANLTRFVTEVRARRAFPILATPIVVRSFDGEGALRDRHGPYPGIVRSVAASEGAPLLDMQALSAAAVAEAGPEGSKDLYQHLPSGLHPNYPDGLSDDIHLSPKGARVLAQRAARGLVDINSPLAAFLRTGSRP